MKPIFEDNHLLVLNKPAGLLTQPGQAGEDSLEAQAKDYLKQKYRKPGAVYLHAIHRLDKPVSGLVVFAKTSKALSRLNSEIRAKRTTKEYLALIEGRLPQEQGVLEDYLFHAEHQAKVVPEGQLSRLTYQVLRRINSHTLIHIHLDTGRYHQIRVQLSHAGCPIVGDVKYGSKASFIEGAIALHHQIFSIAHPVTKEIIIFKAPIPNWAN